MNLFKNGSFLLFLAVMAVIIGTAYGYENASIQTPQIQTFKFTAVVDCNFNPIEEIDTNGFKSLNVYDYPVEFLAESITYEKDAIILHNVFLYKHTYRNIYKQPRTEYLDPTKYPENFFQTVIINFPSQAIVTENDRVVIIVQENK